MGSDLLLLEKCWKVTFENTPHPTLSSRRGLKTIKLFTAAAEG